MPQLGVDLAYTCARCIRHHTRENSLVEDFAQLAQSFDSPCSSRSYSREGRRSKSGTSLTQSTSDYGSSSPVSMPSSTCSLASTMTPCGSPRVWEQEYKVIVSQYHNQKLHSVCSLLGDYLECKGGAIVLADEEHIWVLGHKGLRTSVLHSDTFLSICHRAIKGQESFSVSKRKRSASGQQHQQFEVDSSSRDAFHFFSAAPILLGGRHPTPIGCIIALDTRSRDDSAARKVQKTLENLAQMVMSLLVEEKTILRIYTSGDFRIFASNGLDLAPSSVTPFEKFGVVPSPKASLSSECCSAAARTTRSRSFAAGDDSRFFARYAEVAPSVLGRPSPRSTAQPKSSTNRKHAVSNPEQKKEFSTSKPASRLWKNESTLRAA